MQVVIPVNQKIPEKYQEESSVLERTDNSQEIRDGTPKWQTVVKVVLIIALIVAAFYVGKIITPAIVDFLTTTGNAGATVINSTATVIDSVATTVNKVADSTVVAVESVGTAAEAIGRGVSAINTSVGVTFEKVAMSTAKTIDFIGNAVTRPLTTVLMEEFIFNGPNLVTEAVPSAAPWKVNSIMNLVKVFAH